MNNILLVGGEGYIGRVISNHFLDLNYKVYSIDNYIYGIDNYPPKIKNDNFTFINADMANKDAIEEYIINSKNVILLAGLVGDPITKKYPYLSNQVNDKGIKNIIDICMLNKDIKLIFTSTCSNYGLIPENVRADENYKLDPLSLYAKSKVRAEKYILSFKGKTESIPTILRFATAFGLSDRMRFDLTINQFVRALEENKELVVFDEHTWRPYCHVKDFARAIEAIVSSEKSVCNFEVFNCGSDRNNFTKKMIIDEICKYTKTGKVVYKQNDSDPRNYKVNFDKINSQIGFDAKYDVDFGIREIKQAMKDNLFDFNSKCEYGNYEII